MANKVKLKDIAAMAGVSVGTVDRILHNRGRFSAETKAVVEKIIEDTGYRCNLHVSAISLRKELRFAVAIPVSSPGDYWGLIADGIAQARHDYMDIPLTIDYIYYDQYDSAACLDAFLSVPETRPDAVIIGSIFADATRILCEGLAAEGIPYFFVDSFVSGTSPIAGFLADQYACGSLVASLLHKMTPAGSDILVLDMERRGKVHSSNFIARREGIVSYLTREGMDRRLIEAAFSVAEADENRELRRLLSLESGISGIAVMNSRGHIVADILKDMGRSDIKLVGFDITLQNAQRCRDGSMTALIGQRPEKQGYDVVVAAISYVLYGKCDSEATTYLPIDVVFRENLSYYGTDL